MISKIGVDNRNINSVHSTISRNNKDLKNPNFKGGGGIWPILLQGFQECEKNPMVNVAVIDMFSAILPRTFVESLTNWFAGFEALRRESSGLIVNCLIPSVITMGCAMGINKLVMPKGINLARCWADNSLINRAADIYSQTSSSGDRIKDSLKEIISNIEGFHGKNNVVVKDVFTDKEIESYAQKLSEITKLQPQGRKARKAAEKEVDKVVKEIVDKTHVYENIKVGGKGQQVKATTVSTLLNDTVKYFREFRKAPEGMNMSEFAKKGKSLVKSKSAAGLLIVLPLAASMQYINRWITEKTSGVKGAPIYDDFGKDQDEEIRAKSQEGLLKQKIISISSMIGVALLSMMKKPTWSMLEFKGIFPTMDQARIISTTTFASRMAAADDKNELAEATVRDIATFSSMYFLGDYVGKAAATAIQKKTGVMLLNETKQIDKNANAFKKFWHWVKDVNIKSSEEVVSKTAEELKAKGITPDKTQAAKIQKELKRAINLRSACQAANLGVSLLLLGLVVPICTRKRTQKKHAEAKRQAHENSSGVNLQGVNPQGVNLQGNKIEDITPSEASYKNKGIKSARISTAA